jgi:hypothetical protein
MTFRNWRFTEETLAGIIEKSPTALEAFTEALKSAQHLAALREPIETAVDSILRLSLDLLAAHEYLKDADTEADRLRVRIRELEGFVFRLPPAPQPRPGIDFQRTGTGNPPPLFPGSITNAGEEALPG